MSGAVLTEPVSPGSDAGILFMHNAGYCGLSSHGIVAAITLAIEHRMLTPGNADRTVVLDTVVGTIRARAHVGDQAARVARVAYLCVPAFVLCGGLPVTLGKRSILADVAFGGAFYAIVDSEAVGLALTTAEIPELRRVGAAIADAVESTRTVVHPAEPRLRGVHGVVFTGPSGNTGADLKSVTVFAEGQIDRSPSESGTAALMAVLDAMGLLGPDTPFVNEGVIGTRLTGRVMGRTLVGEHQAIVPELEGTAWATGEHTFVVDRADPLGGGFRT